MTNLLTELLKVYIKLGGNKSDIPPEKLNDLEYIVDKIEDKVSGNSGSGYDAIVKIYHSNNSGDDYEFTIEKGDYASLLAMLNDNEMPHILVKVCDNLFGVHGTTDMVAVYGFNNGMIEFVPKVPVSQGGKSSTEDIIYSSYLNWNPDDTLGYHY